MALAPGASNLDPGKEQGKVEADTGMIITRIRATDVAVGLRRLPAGFYVAIHHGDLEWRTQVKPSSVNYDDVEWDEPIPIPSALSDKVRLEVYASFEFNSVLGAGEQLRRLTVTVEQLFDRSVRDAPFTLYPKDGDVVSPCSSISVTVQHRSSDLSPMISEPYRTTTKPLEDATNHGYSALSRYRRYGVKRDLEHSIERFERALSTCPLNHPCRATVQSNLAMAKSILYQVEGRHASHEDPIRLYRGALETRPVGHVDRPSTLIQLAMVHLARLEKSGDKVEDAWVKALLQEAIELSSAESHTNQAAMFMLQLHAAYLVNPAVSQTSVEQKPVLHSTHGVEYEWLLERYEQTGDLAALEQAITILKDLVGSTSAWDDHYSANLCNLGRALLHRSRCLGKLGDLEDAIAMLRGAIGLVPRGHFNEPSCHGNLGVCFLTRFERLGELRNLDDAISTFRNTINLTPSYHPNRPSCLGNLGNALRTRFEHLGKFRDLEDAISTLSHAITLTPPDHPDRPTYLNNLGTSLRVRFERLGELHDLEDAVSMLRDAARLTPPGHPIRPACLTNLGNALRRRVELFIDYRGLQEGVSALMEAVQLTPPGHPDMPFHLNLLGSSFVDCFKCFSDFGALDDAISTLKVAVDLTPPGHPQKHSCLNNLGRCFFERFQHFGELCDLEDGIAMFRAAVDLTPHGRANRFRCLSNLSTSLLTRFEHTGTLRDLEDAISLFNDAFVLAPPGHPKRASLFYTLGDCFRARFERLGELNDMENSISLYSHAATAPFGSIRDRFQASRKWILFAHFVRHHSLLNAYSVAMNLLPQLAWIGLSLAERYAEIARASEVVREAAAAALDAGYPETAVEWLERGRSIVWGGLFQLRGSYEELSSTYAHKLRALSAELEQASVSHENHLSAVFDQSRDVTRVSLREAADRHRALAIQRDQLLQEIQRLPGFQGFFRQKRFSQLRASAHAGPVVMLNAAKSRCDALIIVPNVDHVIHVPLPDFTLERSTGLRGMLKGFVRHAREGRSAPWDDATWESLLSPLWRCVVKPVLDGLAFSIPGELSRIFWCPTGPFTFLPIHAAGLYDDRYSPPGHKVFDYVVSSYVPSLSILAPSPNPVAVPNDKLRLLVVRQPSSDGQSHLPGVIAELEHIKAAIAHSPSSSITLVESKTGTVEEVLDLMKDADWAHFACHGIQEDVHSGLCLADRRRLKVADVIALSRPRGGLAFLSACQTATGEQQLSDEALHIAAGMLFAGYGGVVGTLWSISDWLAPVVARDVYDHLFRNDARPDCREAARALHGAIAYVRESGRASFAEWVPFVHVGL